MNFKIIDENATDNLCNVLKRYKQKENPTDIDGQDFYNSVLNVLKIHRTDIVDELIKNGFCDYEEKNIDREVKSKCQKENG